MIAWGRPKTVYIPTFHRLHDIIIIILVIIIIIMIIFNNSISSSLSHQRNYYSLAICMHFLYHNEFWITEIIYVFKWM